MKKDELTRYIRRCQTAFDKPDEECDYAWKWYGTLRFQWPPTRNRARSLFYRLLRNMKKEVEPHFLNWFAVFEHGRWDKEIRIHVLLGGSLFSFKEYWILYWWGLGGGKALIFDYRPGVFARYVLKEARAESYFEVATDLCGWGLFEIDHNEGNDRRR